jgi:hypothetical protein
MNKLARHPRPIREALEDGLGVCMYLIIDGVRENGNMDCFAGQPGDN